MSSLTDEYEQDDVSTAVEDPPASGSEKVRDKPSPPPATSPTENGEAGQASSEHRMEPTSNESSADGQPERTKKPIYKRLVPLTVCAMLGIAVLLGVGMYYLYALQFVTTDDAMLDGDVIQIAPQVAGPVKALLVNDNDHVQQGDLLLRIDPSDYQVALNSAQAKRQSARAQLQAAQANLATTTAGLAVAKANVQQSQAKVEVARANLNTATSDLKRYQQVDPAAVSRQRVDNARDRARQMKAELAAAKQRQASAQADVKSAQAKSKSAEAKIETAKAGIAQAQTQIAKAKLQLSYTTIRAPRDGQIAKLPIEEGDYVKPGQALMALVPPRIWVVANFKETQITHMHPGQPVDIEIDAYPDRTFKGHVQSLQRGTGSRFALLPPQNATGNYVKVVQRVPVKILFDKPPTIASIAPGMSVEPSVKIRHYQWWPWGKPDIVQGQKPVVVSKNDK